MRQLKLSLLSAENMYYYTYNQVYKSRIDLANLYHLKYPSLKIKLLNRISNENCKIIDYLTVVATVNTSQDYQTYIWPAINMVQNFFSELNQDSTLYHQLLELEKEISQDLQKQDKQVARFLRILKEDFELKSGINRPQNVQVLVQNSLVKIEEYAQTFSTSLTSTPHPVLFPYSLYQTLPPELQKYINDHVLPDEANKTKETEVDVIKPIFNYSQVSSLFTLCPSLEQSRKLFEICLNFNRSNIFTLYNLIKERTKYATFLGFQSYLDYQMNSLTSWKYNSKEGFTNNLGNLKQFIETIKNKYSEEASQTLFYLQKSLPQGTTSVQLSDIFYLRNQMVHTNFQLSGVKFLIPDIMDFFNRIISRLFNLHLSFEECEGIHSQEKILLVQIKDTQDVVRGLIYLDLFSRNDKAEINQQFFMQSGCDVSLSESFEREQKPIFYISCNVSKYGDNLAEEFSPLKFELNFQAMKTLVHEFGHSINNILNSDKFQLSSSTLLIDYAETMAALFEKLCIHPRSLEYYFNLYNYNNNDELTRILQDLSATQEVFRPWNLLEQIFYANVDLKFHSLNKNQIDGLSPKQLSTLYAEALSETYGGVQGLDLSNYQNLAWFTNIEHLGSYGGLYFAYLLADYYSEKKIRDSLIRDIFDEDINKTIPDKELLNYLFRNAHSEDIYNKLWID